MGATLATVAVVAYAVAFAQVTGSPQGLRNVKCKFSEYLDSGTNDCEPCHDICDNAKITRTWEQCQKECSDYIRSLNCTIDEFYDDVVHSCAPCGELCDAGVITKTSDECVNKCKVYMQRKDGREAGRMPEGERFDGQQAAEAFQPPVSSERTGPSVSTGTIVVIVIAAASLVVLAIILATLARWLCRRRHHDTEQRERRYTDARQEETTGLPGDIRGGAVIALLSGEALREDFGPSCPAGDSGVECAT